MKIAITTIVKNEASTLLEWLAYHRALGIEEFILIDNYSTDGTWELLQQLRRRGLIHAFRFKTFAGQAPQVDAYQKALNAYGKRYDVLVFIDADEYLAPMEGQSSLAPTIERLFEADDVSAVALNWACFGSSQAVFKESGLVPERFTTRAPQEMSANCHVKTMVRSNRIIRFFNPHQAWLSEGRYIMSNGEPMLCSKRYGVSQTVSWEGLRVNHYVVKSLEEFLARKSRVGSAARPGKIKHRRYFEAHDRNEEVDEGLLPYMAATRGELEALQRHLAFPRRVEHVEAWLRTMKGWVEYGRWKLRRWRLYGAKRMRYGPIRHHSYVKHESRAR